MFSARRKPKRIARDEPERNSDEEEEKERSSPVVRRPNAAPKTKSKLRTSFAPDEAEDSSDTPATVVVKARPRPGGGRTSASSQSLPRFNIESRPEEDSTSRPSYSKTALEELRNSTPSTPRDLTIYNDPASSGAEEGIRDLDLSSKFGPHHQSSTSTSIPSATEIAEKKARRARLGQEQKAEDFISLEDNDTLYDSDGEFKPRRLQVGSYLRPDPVEKDTRLIHEDEDLMEGFENFTEDAQSKRITMSRAEIQKAQRHDREAMRQMIDHAEGSHSSESDSDSDSEIERNQAYITAQTSHGMDGLMAAKASINSKPGSNRPRQPREITSVPKLNVALGRLRERIAQVEIDRVKVESRMAEIKRERGEIRASQEHIQRSLTDAGEELRKIVERRREEEDRDGRNGGGGVDVGGPVQGRGLDSMGVDA